MIDEPQRPTVERFVAAVADATGTAGDVAGTVERVAASARRVAARRRDDRRPVAGGGAAAVGPAGAAGVAGTGRAGRPDEPGLVRGAPARAGRRRCAPRPRARRGRPRGGPRSASGCWSTCRCASQVGGRLDDRASRLVEAWLENPAIRGVPAHQRLGRRGVVPPRVVGGAGRLGGPPRARRDADRGAGRAPGRAQRRSRAGCSRRARRRATGSTGCARRWRRAWRPGPRATPRLPRATGLPPGSDGAGRVAWRLGGAAARAGVRRRHARGPGRGRRRHGRTGITGRAPGALTARAGPEVRNRRNARLRIADRPSPVHLSDMPSASPGIGLDPAQTVRYSLAGAQEADSWIRSCVRTQDCLGRSGRERARDPRTRRCAGCTTAGQRRPASPRPSMIRRRIGNGGAPCEMTASRWARSSKPGVRG